MTMLKKIFFMLPFLLMGSSAISQGIINNGANFYIEPGAFIYGGTFTNQTNGTDGAVKLDGTMILEGDFLNNAAGNNVFINIEPVPNGTVLLNGDSLQSIGGSTPTHFENLGITNASKILNVNDCEVKGNYSDNAILDLNHYRIIIDNLNLNKCQTLNEISKSSLLIPNVFTPNGDGFNDFFQIQATGIEDLRGQIFDSRGHLLFEWSGLEIKWDGYFDGKPVSDGTYFYIITATSYDKKEYHETGTITVIK